MLTQAAAFYSRRKFSKSTPSIDFAKEIYEDTKFQKFGILPGPGAACCRPHAGLRSACLRRRHPPRCVPIHEGATREWHFVCWHQLRAVPPIRSGQPRRICATLPESRPEPLVPTHGAPRQRAPARRARRPRGLRLGTGVTCVGVGIRNAPGAATASVGGGGCV